MTKLALFLPNWVGDVVMATPTIRALRRRFGNGATLVAVARPALRDVLDGTDWIDEWVPHDPRSSDARLRSRAVALDLRKRRLDIAVLLTNSWRTAFIAALARIPRRVGDARGGRGLLLTDRVYAARRAFRFVPTSAVASYLSLAARLGCDAESPRLELGTTEADERRADAVWTANNWTAKVPVVTLNNSGAFGAAKLWPMEHCVELARRLAQQRGFHVLVLCGPKEREAARQITAMAAEPRVASLADHDPSIGLTKACVRRSALLVTTDSGPRHFAAAFGVPVVTLFGPTHQAWSDTLHEAAANLQLDLPCGPCQRRTCPLGHHRCMRELTPTAVMSAIEQLSSRADEPARSRRPAA